MRVRAGLGARRTRAAVHALPFVIDDEHTRSLHFANGELQSRMRLQQPDVLELEYTRAMMGFLLFNKQPASIALIGLGGGSLVKFCHRHLPRTRLTVLELNPQVIALRERFGVPPDDKRLRVLEADGARFVHETVQRFDVLLVDAFDEQGLPPALSTAGFYEDCRDRLLGEGILVVNLHAAHPDYALIVGRIARSFGANVLEVIVQRDGNSVVFASRGQLLWQRQHGVLRGDPRSLSREAWAELRPTFAQVMSSLDQRSAPGP